jgi:aerobic carbon-monoxide dehydrogenase large subunit
MAMVEAVAKVVELGKEAASHLLEAAPQDIEFAGGHFTIAGTDRSIGVLELAEKLRAKPTLPEGAPSSLDVKLASENVPSAFPNGCHVAEVEVDPDTGGVRILNYVALQDSGVLINPMMVDGQVVGGVAHGIGNAILEWMGFDESGQPTTTTLADYLLPSAMEVPFIQTIYQETPSPLNPLGAKGAGEVSTIPTAAAVISAIEDALQPFGVRIAQTPITPHKLVELIANGVKP